MNNPLNSFHYNRAMRRMLQNLSYEMLQLLWLCVLEAEQDSENICERVNTNNVVNEAKVLHNKLHYIAGYGNCFPCKRPSADKICKWLWHSNNEYCQAMFTVVWQMSKKQPRYRFNEKAYRHFSASYIAWISEVLSETGIVTMYDIQRELKQLLLELQSMEYIDDTKCV